MTITIQFLQYFFRIVSEKLSFILFILLHLKKMKQFILLKLFSFSIFIQHVLQLFYFLCSVVP